MESRNYIEFNEQMLNSIKNKSKKYTIRNNPVILGNYNIDKDLKIKITKCEIIKSDYNYFNYKPLGFNNHTEMINFYKNYINNEFSYKISFIVL